MPDEMPDFSAIPHVLETAGVRSVLIGVLAMVAHGSAHVTVDVDVSYAREDDNLKALASALAPLHPELRGAPPDLPFILDQRTLKSAFNLTLRTDFGPLDLLGGPAGIASFESLQERAVVMQVEGVPVHVASVDDLIAMKRAAGRVKDQSHILELEALRRLMREESTRAADAL